MKNDNALPTVDTLLTEFRSLALQDNGRALAALVQRLRDADAPATIWQKLAERLLADGDAANAGGLLEQGLAIYPDVWELRYLLGNSLCVRGMPAAGEEEFRKVLSHQPEHAQAALALAFRMRERGRMQEATDLMRQRWAHSDRTARDAERTATFIVQCDHQPEALRVYTEALQHCPDARLYMLRGSLALTLARFDQATHDLHRAVELDPGQATAWLWLAITRKFRTRDDPDLLALEAIARSTTDPEVRICAGFALSKMYDDLHDIPAAARVLGEANAEVAARIDWQVSEWADFVARQIESRPPAPVAAASDLVPVFVVGMPRTGTTLIGTLLERHTQVCNRGELGWLAAAAHQGASQSYSREFLTAVARLYRAQLIRDEPRVRCYIDKNPFNFRHLDLAAALFPHARVIHCRRDPRDTALSNWQQYFVHADNGYAYRFSDIAAAMHGHDRLMAHWRRALPLPIYELDYETLVNHPQETVADVLRFLDLDPLEQPETATAVEERAIATCSMWQVRQPVYRTSVGRWRAYAPYVPELAEFRTDR